MIEHVIQLTTTRRRASRCASGRGPFRRILLHLLLVLLGTAMPAVAQDDAVAIELTQVGVGGAISEASVAGIEVKLTVDPASALPTSIPVFVQWEVENADGDIPVYRRAATLTKSNPSSIWLYAPTRPSYPRSPTWRIRVLEANDKEAGKEIGSAILPSNVQPISAYRSVIAVTSTITMGLGEYDMSYLGGAGARPPAAHERTSIQRVTRVSELPDSWRGYLMLDTLVWVDVDPVELRHSQRSAIRRWVQGGGHLVIVLPSDGTNPWSLGQPAANELEDLLPAFRPDVDQDVPLESLLSVLTKARGLAPEPAGTPPATLQLQSFGRVGPDIDADALRERLGAYVPLQVLDDGRIVTIQRRYGHGRITIIGIDLTATALRTRLLSTGVRATLPDADHFWNLILGRRADTPRPAEALSAEQAEQFNRKAITPNVIARGTLVGEEIKHAEQAGKGLAMAVLLFIAYWLLAGPLGFWLLKAYGYIRHAWIAYFGAALVFTGIAWGGVRLLRENEMKLKHFTVVDFIATPADGSGLDDAQRALDPPLMRGTAWFGLYLPGYGNTQIGFTEDATSDPYDRQLIFSWSPPPEGRGQDFPNVVRYPIDISGNEMTYEIPRRSTSVELEARYLGPISESFGMITQSPDDPIRVTYDAAGNPQLSGRLLNGTSETLTNVQVIWVLADRPTPPRYSVSNDIENAYMPVGGQGRMRARAYLWTPIVDNTMAGRTTMWNSGASITFSDGSGGPLSSTSRSMTDSLFDINTAKRYVEPRLDSGFMGGGAVTNDTRIEDRIAQWQMLTYYHQLQPPKYLSPGQSPEDIGIIQRLMGRELDLSGWFARPCLIVTGFARSACPLPFEADSEPVASEGLTMVRWILPLDVSYEHAFPDQYPDADESAARDAAPAGAPDSES